MKKLIGLAILLLLFLTGFTQGKELAAKHSIIYNKPAPGFFEGALLGNGGLGIVVTTRPDAIVFYFGHNNIWDIRIAEEHKEELKDFNYVFNKVKDIPDTLTNLSDDPWYNQYNQMSGDNYRKKYPRPFPCGSILLGFDTRKVQMVGHTLDISNGLCSVRLLTVDNKELILRIFTNMKEDKLMMLLTDKDGHPQKNIFERVKVIPDPSTPAEFPHYAVQEELSKGILSFRQILPSIDNKSNKAFRLTAKMNSLLSKTTRINWNGNKETMLSLEAALSSENIFNAVMSLEEGTDSLVSKEPDMEQPLSPEEYNRVFKTNVAIWDQYWSKSSVQLSDSFLEEIWYRNLYFFNCAAKDGVTCPGLYANWSYKDIGTAWHGDYHMNYNTQQPFWMTFSSNHLEKNLPYVNLIESLMPVSRQWAKEYYGLPGAYFPHSAYPVKMTMNPYPVPDWGWEVCETPWAVQGLWWHYLYSGDTAFLRTRAYQPMKAAVEFLTAYMKRPDAHGDARWKDKDYHIFPTIPPELYGLRPGFKYNYDCSIDLTLTRFIFNAFKQAVELLHTDEKKLLADVNDVLAHFPAYPTAHSKEYGDIFVSAPGEHDKVVYNVPNALITVFPGEDHGLHSDPATLQKLKSTFYNQQNEGGNALVFMNLQAARIGMLDIERFKRHVQYALLPNGTATDVVLQVHGRYNDLTDYYYMSKMGIWFENFALPVVINECLMQSYDGSIRLFPNWPAAKDAAFTDLRAAGAFLVSARQVDGNISSIKILSEKGNELRVIIPWSKGVMINGKKRVNTKLLTMKTSPGEMITLTP
ncbi:Glycosyl hydrolase family 65, N-terminal domain [Chitinophaga sp. CF118]|uniref:glycosyl hydrolase family 95 catalytic domain-containing protein n=1 Tax=Chitinophaga sp. CF118 TaxID=1884367 RepID=UPI0008E7958A|nr:glycoside hydrolase N-terminal domain-containing protein [Chitinophaga sp. CF118]SFD47607.1 Glycosyl hydrolase family 65, N-terminal domain [Chitinophaga sp. CF118]